MQWAETKVHSISLKMIVLRSSFQIESVFLLLYFSSKSESVFLILQYFLGLKVLVLLYQLHYLPCFVLQHF